MKIYPHELIGQEIEIIDSRNQSNLSIKGKVVDETKNTLKVMCGENIKTLLKSNITLKIVKTGKVLEGKELLRRPEERIKGK